MTSQESEKSMVLFFSRHSFTNMLTRFGILKNGLVVVEKFDESLDTIPPHPNYERGGAKMISPNEVSDLIKEAFDSLEKSHLPEYDIIEQEDKNYYKLEITYEGKTKRVEWWEANHDERPREIKVVSGKLESLMDNVSLKPVKDS